MFAGEVDASEERAAAAGEFEGGVFFRGEEGFARGDEFIRKKDGGCIHELAEVLLGPGVIIVEAGAKFFGMEGKAGGDGFEDCDFRFEVGGACHRRERRKGREGRTVGGGRRALGMAGGDGFEVRVV